MIVCLFIQTESKFQNTTYISICKIVLQHNILQPLMATECKGNSVSLETFHGWGKDEIIDSKIEVDCKGGRTMVTYIWCKLCVKFKDSIMNSSLVKVSARAAPASFINGTNSVTRYQVCRLFILIQNFMVLV